MKKLALVLIIWLLSACTSQEPTVPPVIPSITVVDGPATAEALTRRYNDTRANCGSDSMPAFLCSGVIIRATTYDPGYDTWDPSPKALAKGSVSFSYLRKDNNLQSFAWRPSNPNGFISYPIIGNPPDKLDLPILCHFPMDGWTGNRTEWYGCGVYPGAAGSYASPEELDPARRRKQNFLTKTGIDLPIIEVTLPTTATGSATFQYIAADQ